MVTKPVKRKNSGAAKKRLILALALLIVLPYIGLWYLNVWYDREIKQIANARLIIVDKEKMLLRLMDYHGEEQRSYGICCGKSYGNKQTRGDMKTPEGIVHITDIEASSDWEHDFHDGKGRIKGAYGPWFLRLSVPNHKGIGIHGTHKPESIGHRETEGCIRLKNCDIIDLKERINTGIIVIVLPSYTDLAASSKDSLQRILTN